MLSKPVCYLAAKTWTIIVTGFNLPTQACVEARQFGLFIKNIGEHQLPISFALSYFTTFCQFADARSRLVNLIEAIMHFVARNLMPNKNSLVFVVIVLFTGAHDKTLNGVTVGSTKEVTRFMHHDDLLPIKVTADIPTDLHVDPATSDTSS